MSTIWFEAPKEQIDAVNKLFVLLVGGANRRRVTQYMFPTIKHWNENRWAIAISSSDVLPIHTSIVDGQQLDVLVSLVYNSQDAANILQTLTIDSLAEVNVVQLIPPNWIQLPNVADWTPIGTI